MGSAPPQRRSLRRSACERRTWLKGRSGVVSVFYTPLVARRVCYSPRTGTSIDRTTPRYLVHEAQCLGQVAGRVVQDGMAALARRQAPRAGGATGERNGGGPCRASTKWRGCPCSARAVGAAQRPPRTFVPGNADIACHLPFQDAIQWREPLPALFGGRRG